MGGRLQLLVATAVALSAFYRFNDEGFIIQSFHEHGNSSGRIGGRHKHRRLPAQNVNSTAQSLMQTRAVYPNVGDFCPYCVYNEERYALII